MNKETFKAIGKTIGETYSTQALEARSILEKYINELMIKKQCPPIGWSNEWIEHLLNEISRMDSNNFSHNIGVGERESRIYSTDIVSRRHFGFGHGIGRSGDLREVQPKAAGSSLIYKLTNSMVLHLIKLSGIRSTVDCFVVPTATGLTITICLLTVRRNKPKAKYVIWPRIDQKSCFKSIIAAGFEPLIIENVQEGDELRTNLEEIERVIKKVSPELVAAVMSTTSCFAPRGIDKVEEIAKICKDNNIYHIINNAYGLQSSKCTHHIEQAGRFGRVDAFIQSTDKNFMVPVGGAIIGSFNKAFIQEISEIYPGRGSSSPVMDLFITLLSMGVAGYELLLKERKRLRQYLEEELTKVADNFKLRILSSKNNPISIAMTLPQSESITELGSMLFIRGVSGTRVVDGEEAKGINGYNFKSWGSHTNNCTGPYLTAAAAIGMKKQEVDKFIEKLQKCLPKFCDDAKSASRYDAECGEGECNDAEDGDVENGNAEGSDAEGGNKEDSDSEDGDEEDSDEGSDAEGGDEPLDFHDKEHNNNVNHIEPEMPSSD